MADLVALMIVRQFANLNSSVVAPPVNGRAANCCGQHIIVIESDFSPSEHEDILEDRKWNLSSYFSSDQADHSAQHLMQQTDTAWLHNSCSIQMAMDKEEIIAYYQPKLDLRNCRICGAEALVRWRHPNHGVIGPASFLDDLHRFGLLSHLTVRMIDLVTAAIKRWQALGDGLTVSVNVTWPDVEDGSLYRILETACSRFGIAPRFLQIELSEKSSIRNIYAAALEVRNLRAAGFSVAIDDFGVENSSLWLLRNIECDVIKFDRSLVQGVGTDRRAAALLKSLIAMAETLGADTVAEGVEDTIDLECLIELGCHQIQGYIYAAPMPEDKFVLHYFRKNKEPFPG